MKPISPNEIAATKIRIFPDRVIEIWNEIIALKYSRGYATIFQHEIVNKLAIGMDIDRNVIFLNGYLDIEDIYQAHGWSVEYDKPGYDETYEPFFKFQKK